MLRHPEQNPDNSSLIIGDHVQTRATASGLDVSWCLRSRLPDDIVDFLGNTTEPIPLSVCFKHLTKPKVTRPTPNGPLLHHPQRVEIQHVAIVSRAAYPWAVLRHLARAS